MFKFTRYGLNKRERAVERFFEVLPGATSWTILLGMVTVSIWDPILGAVLVIAIDFYWLLRLFYMTIFLVLAYLRLSMEQDTDWMARVRELDNLVLQSSSSSTTEKVDNDVIGNHPFTFKRKLSERLHRRKMKYLRRSSSLPPPSDHIYHLVILSVAKELRPIVEAGIESLAQQEFPPGRIVVMIALEDRAEAEVKEGVKFVQEKYCHRFFDFLIAVHPDELPGEGRVKGANVTYAAKAAVKFFEGKGISFEHVIVSCFDADTVVSRKYFSCLTYHFMIYPRRNQASFQPIPVYHNNIWEVPAFARVLDIGSSFFQLIEATNPDQLVTFSSHSMSFKALVEVGYWPVDMISDDSAIYWKSLIHYDGRYRVVPLYVTLSMDVVSGDSWWKTIVSVYRQKRRWAWGVENFPIVMRGFFANQKISLYDKLRHGFKLFEDHIAWATWAFLITFIGWLPVLFARREFSNSVLYYSSPRITGTIFNLAFPALVITIVLSLLLLPKKKVKNPLLKRIGFAFEWLLIPFVVVFLGALPALDAQTRLAFGKYMEEFWVSEKRKK